MNVKNVHSMLRKRQQGAILTISLIILFLLSILGLAVMKTSTLEEKMAANSLHEDIAFQAAETISESIISDAQNMTDAYNSATHSIPVTHTNSLMSEVTATSTVSYTGQGIAHGYSFGEDSGSFQAYRFIVDSTGTINQANTATRIIQGTYRVAPASQGD